MSAISSQRKSRVKPLAWVLAAFIVVAVAAYTYASPYIALSRMKTAADARDADALSQYVDYPALRTSLKQQLGDLLVRRFTAEHGNNPLMLFGLAIGSALVGPLVDVYVTPEGVAGLLDGIPPDTSGTGQPAHNTAAPPAAAQTPASPALAPLPGSVGGTASSPATFHTETGYRSFNVFAVTRLRDRSSERFTIILRRHGLFSWQLSAVELNR